MAPIIVVPFRFTVALRFCNATDEDVSPTNLKSHSAISVVVSEKVTELRIMGSAALVAQLTEILPSTPSSSPVNFTVPPLNAVYVFSLSSFIVIPPETFIKSYVAVESEAISVIEESFVPSSNIPVISSVTPHCPNSLPNAVSV